MTERIHRLGLRFLRVRWRVLVRLGGWSVLETAQTFLTGYAPARALDAGFLAGRPEVGLGWLAVAGLGVLVGAYGTARVYAAVAALVEPLRDRLVERVVARGVREADAGALSGLTQQVEIARDTFAGLVMVSRSFLFTTVGALVGLFSLDPLLLLVVGPPLLAGVGLFAATLGPLARRQETFLVADEALAENLGAVCPGLRDVTASGAETRIAAGTDTRIDTELRAARSLARWGVLRVASLALGGQLPIVLLLVAAPWLLDRGVTPGALVGALAYVTQSLLPALNNLVHGLGSSGSRLVVVLRRLVREKTADTTADTTDHDGPAPQAPTEDTDSTGSTGPSASHAPHLTALSLASVTFAYGPHSAPVIDDLDLDVPAGAHLAVVGPSGIGKSTLTALVAGLLRPGRGTVRVDGRPVTGPGAVGRRVLIPHPGDPGHHGGARRGPCAAGLLPQAHPVRGARADRAQCGRHPVHAGVHGEGGRLLLPGLRIAHAARGRGEHQPRLVVRPLPRRPGLHGRPARLVPGLRGGTGPDHAGLGDRFLGAHTRPRGADPHRGLPAAAGVHRRVPVPGGPVHT
ncbi:ABC transporter ATP-binding protein, AmfA [Streptomyces lincolnensis]|nr:ABC transporter ATP-binding protein, AmfA [Streptomyces lincolnensis]